MLRTRIAPTPSGYVHIGNAVNFVLTWLWARRDNGIVRLRIDDRSTPVVEEEYLQDIFTTLEWLGLYWDEGPRNGKEQREIYSEHLPAQTKKYAALLDKIAATGNVFACTCSRKAIIGRNDTCACRSKNIPLQQPDVAWRVVTPENLVIKVPDVVYGSREISLPTELHDFLIRRRDGMASYQVMSLCDDLEYKTNLLIRGMDLLPSTASQLFLGELIGDTSFSETQFYHHPLIRDHDGDKLSKSAGSNAFKSWGPKTTTTEEFYRWMCHLLGWEVQVNSAKEMLEQAKKGAKLTFES